MKSVALYTAIAFAVLAQAAPSAHPEEVAAIEVAPVDDPYTQYEDLAARGFWDSPIFNDARAHMIVGAQRIEEMMVAVRKDPSRAGAAIMSSFIAGLDGQVDASLGTIFQLAHYATFGLSDPVANFILGPFFQAVTDGVEVVLGNVAGGAADLALSPFTGSLYKNVKRLVKEGKAYHMDVDKLAHMSDQLSMSLPAEVKEKADKPSHSWPSLHFPKLGNKNKKAKQQ